MHEKSIKVTTHSIIGNYEDKKKKERKLKLKTRPFLPLSFNVAILIFSGV